MKRNEIMKQTASHRFSLILIMIIILVLGISFVLSASYKPQNYCIKIGENYLVGNCQIGCCIEDNGIQHNNYPNGRCIELSGRFYEGICTNMNICRGKI